METINTQDELNLFFHELLVSRIQIPTNLTFTIKSDPLKKELIKCSQPITSKLPVALTSMGFKINLV